jgi:hypothetical protein
MSFALNTYAATVVGAKRAPVTSARLRKSVHIPRRVHSTVTRAATKADESNAIKPFEVRTRAPDGRSRQFHRPPRVLLFSIPGSSVPRAGTADDDPRHQMRSFSPAPKISPLFLLLGS